MIRLRVLTDSSRTHSGDFFMSASFRTWWISTGLSERPHSSHVRAFSRSTISDRRLTHIPRFLVASTPAIGIGERSRCFILNTRAWYGLPSTV